MADFGLSLFAGAAAASTAAGAASAGAAAGAAAAGAGAAGLAGAGAAAAGGTALTAAAGTAAASGTLSTLSTVATVGSMIASLVSGAAAYRQGKDQAMFAGLNAEGQRLEAEERGIRIQRELLQKIGQSRVAFAGSGFDLSSGQAIESNLTDQAAFETGLSRASGEAQAAGLNATAASYRTAGLGKLVAAAAQAAGTGVNTALDIRRRG